MTVIEKRRAVGDKGVGNKLTPQEAARALFADVPRLLDYYRVAVPPCWIRRAVRVGGSWVVPKGTKFPVAMYDRRGDFMVADTEAKLISFLNEHQNGASAILFEVAVGSRFPWIEFEKGHKPRIVDPKGSRVYKVDRHALERLERFNHLFFGDGINAFRLQFAVDSDGHFKLMCGVIKGY